MYEWQRQIQTIVDEVDVCLARHDSKSTFKRLVP